jgi:hypothetical protein
MSKRTQLNARVTPAKFRWVVQEKKRCNKTNDIIVEVALEALMTGYTPDQREKFYAAHQPYSRK